MASCQDLDRPTLGQAVITLVNSTSAVALSKRPLVLTWSELCLRSSNRASTVLLSFNPPIVDPFLSLLSDANSPLGKSPITLLDSLSEIFKDSISALAALHLTLKAPAGADWLTCSPFGSIEGVLYLQDDLGPWLLELKGEAEVQGGQFWNRSALLRLAECMAFGNEPGCT